MTRDEIKKLFPEATDEQISSLLSSHHNELNKLKDDNKSLREKADKFDAAEREKLSQEEKLNKLIEEANKAKADNLRLLNRTKAAAKLAPLGLSEEDYSPILDGFVSDNEEQTLGFADALVKMITSTSAKAAAAAKQELMQTPPPAAGAGVTPSNTADSLKEQFAAAQKSNDMLGMIKSMDAMTIAAQQGTKV